MEAPRPRAEVTVYSPLLSPFRQRLADGTSSIGRASDCTIPVKDRYLSRKHAEIVAVNSLWVLKDCGSANGTYLNGSRVDRDQPLKGGDRIRLGDTEIVFETPEASTDRFLAVANSTATATISIPIIEAEKPTHTSQDVERLITLNELAKDLIEDRPLEHLFGFIVERVLHTLKASRVAIGVLGPEGNSFVNAEVRRMDKSDTSELTISQTLLRQMVLEKKALAYLDVGADEKLSRAQSIVMQGIRSIVCAPLTISDTVVGLLYVDYQIAQRQISEDDVRLVAQIARFAGIKLETTRLREEAIEKRIMDEELKTASLIQRRLLPAAPTGIAGYTFVGFNQPCRTVSGDYYDFVVRPENKIYFVIADVSGKGITAGLMMAGLQASFRIFSKNDPGPSVLVSQLNVALKENLPQSKFVTLFVGRLDTATGIIEYTNAGHSPPLHIRRASVDELGETDLLLGVVTRAEYVTRRVDLQPGDSLVLYTDGVTEAENVDGSELGSERVGASLAAFHGASAEAIGRAITDAVHEHVGQLEIGDDVTLVVVSRDSGDPS